MMQEYAHDLAEARTLEAVWRLHCETLAGFGFDRVIYGATRRLGPDGSLGDPANALVLSNHPEPYNAAFLTGGLFRASPGLAWARQNSGAISWGALWAAEWAAETDRSEAAQAVAELNRAMGVCAGYTLSLVKSDPGSLAVAALSGGPGLSQAALDTVWAEHGTGIWTMHRLLHLKIRSLPVCPSGPPLSARQREALHWVGDGKSYQDIARLMGVSMATVEKHLRLAREKLCAETTAQALLKAALQNQLYPPTGPGTRGRVAAAGPPLIALGRAFRDVSAV